MHTWYRYSSTGRVRASDHISHDKLGQSACDRTRILIPVHVYYCVDPVSKFTPLQDWPERESACERLRPPIHDCLLHGERDGCREIMVIRPDIGNEICPSPNSSCLPGLAHTLCALVLSICLFFG